MKSFQKKLDTIRLLQYKKIQVAIRYEPVDERMYMEKKLYNEYIEFCNEFQERWDKNPGAYQLDVKAFNLWNNARNTATYYICIQIVICFKNPYNKYVGVSFFYHNHVQNAW